MRIADAMQTPAPSSMGKSLSKSNGVDSQGTAQAETSLKTSPTESTREMPAILLPEPASFGPVSPTGSPTNSSEEQLRMALRLSGREVAPLAHSGSKATATGPVALQNEVAPAPRAPRLDLSIEDFDVVGHLGDGSYAEVVLARLRKTGQEVALKIMDKFLVMRSKKVDAVKLERDVLDELSHPGVVRLLFSSQDARCLYLGMEPLRGGELHAKLQKEGPLDIGEARALAAQVVEVIGHLRKHGIIHRDIKPENLVFGPHGRLVLCDFGSCLRVDDQGPDAVPDLAGTAEYVAVEAIDRKRLTAAYDLWGLGCLLFQMLVGRPPFRGATEYLTLQQVAALRYELPEDVDPVAADLVQALLSRDPDARPGASDLDDLRGHPFFEGVDWSSVY